MYVGSMADPGDNTKLEKKRKRFNTDSSVPDSPPTKISPRTERISGGDHELDRVKSVNSILDSQDVVEVDLEHVADLLKMFDVDSDSSDDEIPGLESVFRSLQEEIISAPATEEKNSGGENAAEIESGPLELVFLQEASDDELGLPPRFTASPSNGEEVALEPTVGEVYEPFDLGICGCSGDMDDVAFDGMFADVAEETEVRWQTESLSVL